MLLLSQPLMLRWSRLLQPWRTQAQPQRLPLLSLLSTISAMWLPHTVAVSQVTRQHRTRRQDLMVLM